VSTYQYEETSGYYYDPLTTLYYDANSQYYYNAQTGQFMYWDAEKSTYLPAPSNQVPGSGTEGEVTTDKKKKEDKKEKSKMAKKIAKVSCSVLCRAQYFMYSVSQLLIQLCS
jgi:RNA-binding protein 5/10